MSVRVRRVGIFALVVVVMAAAVGVSTQAVAKPKAKTGTASPACGSATLSNPSPNQGQAPGAGEPFDLTGWLKDKATQVGTKAAEVAFNYLAHITHLDRIIPESDDAKILDQLQVISAQLADVNLRLDAIKDKVDQAIAEARDNQLATLLRAVCDRINQARFIFLDSYMPAVSAGIILGDILKSQTPGDAEKKIGELSADLQTRYGSPPPCTQDRDETKQLACFTPKTLVTERRKRFADSFGPANDRLDRLDTLISNYLRAGTQSVVTAYGKVLMEKRIIGHSDSESLRDLYDQLAHGEALAAWMSAEYHVEDDVDLSRDAILTRFLHNSTAEVAELPPMIPEGAVIDLGDKSSTTSKGRPIWMLATAQDTDYWPVNVETNNSVTTSANGAGLAITALNNKSCDDGAACFTHWRVPARADLVGLMSDGCPKKCTPLVKAGTGNHNVASYMASLNPKDPVWTGVFCDRTGAPGPDGAPVSCAPAPQHGFIWTEDRQTQRMACGFWVPFLTSEFARFYSLRFGFQMDATSLSAAPKLYPDLARQVPGYTNDGPNGGDRAHTRCDDYARAQLALPANKGIVLAIDSTGTPEFMAQ